MKRRSAWYRGWHSRMCYKLDAQVWHGIEVGAIDLSSLVMFGEASRAGLLVTWAAYARRAEVQT